MKGKCVGIVVCVLTIVVVASPAAAQGDLHGSIVFSQEADGGYAWGMAWNHNSEVSAMREASVECRNAGGSSCREVGTFTNACGALAIGDDNGYGTGVGDSIAKAENDALARCRSSNSNCRIDAKASQCTEKVATVASSPPEDSRATDTVTRQPASSGPPAVATLEQQMVTVSGNVQLSKYEVTQELWTAVMGTNPSYFQGCGQCPVEGVSWNDVQVFLEKLNALTGERYRLPTAAEWAGALGSGGGAWHLGNSGKFTMPIGNRTHPVGQKAPNELGLYDMKGNVWEWVEDCTEGNCNARLLLGGSVNDGEDSKWSSGFRDWNGTGNRYWEVRLGFRVARTLTP